MDDFDSDIARIGGIAAIPRILDVICRTTGMGFAAVARVTEDRWIACAVLDQVNFGLLPGSELQVETTLCHEVRTERTEVVIDHVAEDPIYADHHTPRLYGLQSYISVPIVRPDGTFFGTLCALDAKPASLRNPQIIGMFRLFAELISFHLDVTGRLTESEAAMRQQIETAQLREQFIAVLGHDLRNPLASIGSATVLLERQPQNERSTQILGFMRKSVERMGGLIDNVLDFARGRLGGGIPIDRSELRPLGPMLEQVLSETRASHPDRVIETAIDLDQPIAADHGRLGQLFSNLLGNAIHHGDPAQPIRVDARIDGARLVLSVSNGGAPIPPEAMAQLFDPFTRGSVRPNQQGLGLGLYIASQIAQAHGGRIDVGSDAVETRFTFRMPA